MLTLLALSASAATLTLGGACGGPVAIDVTGLTPGGTYAILTSAAPGSLTVPGGPCPGLTLDLSAPFDLRKKGRADAAGEVHITPDLPDPLACGLYMQVVDAQTCTASNVERIDGFPEGPIGDRPVDWETCPGSNWGANVGWGPFSGAFQFYFPLELADPRTLTEVVVESAAGTGTVVTIHVGVYSDAAGPGTLETTGTLAGADGSIHAMHAVDVDDVDLAAGTYWIGVAVFGGMFTPTCLDLGTESFFYGDAPFDGSTNPFTATPPGSVVGGYDSGVNNWGITYMHGIGG